ncbi:hypothetical protein [Rhodococcus opacus]|uniref:hypothetical protein n=1 Tax=Rhodococcus opacus TaxID=37919 RepID=UPI0002E7410A|nr:hypothetical protein [Rhodococcus opacus]
MPFEFASDMWSDHGEWGARALAILGEPVPDPALAERIARETQLPLEDRRALLIRSRDLPDWRRPPPQDESSFDTDDPEVRIYQRAGLDLGVGNFRRYVHGIRFRIEALAPDSGGIVTGADVMNLSFRIRPDLPHRIRLLAFTEPGGTLLTNTAHFGSYPDDADTLWLAGGGSGVRHRRGGISAWGEYFITPHPPAATMTLIASYPEFGIPPSGVVITDLE